MSNPFQQQSEEDCESIPRIPRGGWAHKVSCIEVLKAIAGSTMVLGLNTAPLAAGVCHYCLCDGHSIASVWGDHACDSDQTAAGSLLTRLRARLGSVDEGD